MWKCKIIPSFLLFFEGGLESMAVFIKYHFNQYSMALSSFRWNHNVLNVSDLISVMINDDTYSIETKKNGFGVVDGF